MSYLIFGLTIFLTTHSIRIFADGWRARTIARVGQNPWKGVYSLISIAGLVLLAWGYGQARPGSAVLYDPPTFMRHIAVLLMLISFVLLAAAYVPANCIKSAVGHPMVAGVQVWAFAHLLSTGRLADVVLFGAFLTWAFVDFIAAHKRDRAAGTVYPAGQAIHTALVVVAGVGVWAAFVYRLHFWLIGAPVFA